MRLNEDRQLILLRSCEHSLNQAIDLVVVFKAPANVNSDALISARGMFRSHGVSLAWRVNAVEAAIVDMRFWSWRHAGGDLNALKSIFHKPVVCR